MTLGTVTAIQNNYYQIHVSGEATPRLCKIRSRLKKIGIHVWVGDQVRLSAPEESGDQGAISEVLPRRNQLLRPAIANVDRVVLLLPVRDPDFDPLWATRFLIQIAIQGLSPLVVLNKVDLVDPETLGTLQAQLQSWGYDPVCLSIETGAGLAVLKAHLIGSTAVLAGPSGAGKSSLLNALQPGLALRVGAVSARLGHGKHTTRHVELFTLDQDLRLADTPGFSQLILTCTADQLPGAFPEFAPYQDQCQFRNCSHQREPDCAVREANLDRYPIYLTLLTEILGNQPVFSGEQGGLKTIHRTGNHQQAVPKLATIHRQRSRHTDRQILLNDLDEE